MSHRLTSCEEAIIRFLDRRQFASRHQIAHEAGVSLTYTCTLLRRLIRHRLIQQIQPHPAPRPGRTAYLYRRPTT